MTTQQMNDDVRLVERTRLLRNTAAELGELMDYPLTQGNSLVRKGGKSPVMRHAVHALLASITRKECDLDLGDVLASYRRVDRLLESGNVRARDARDVCLALIDHRFNGTKLDDTLSRLATASDTDLPILLLTLLGVLPRLNANSGDVHDFAALYHVTMSLLKALPAAGIVMSSLPLIMSIEEEYAAGHVNSRLSLIHIVGQVLTAYRAIVMPHLTLEENMQVLREELLPDIDGLYQNQNRDTTFLRVRRIVNAYFLYHYRMDRSTRRLEVTRLTLKLFGDDDQIIALVTHPRLMADVIAGRPFKEWNYAYLDCRLDPDGGLEFYPKLKAFNWFTRDYAERLIPIADARVFEQALNHYTIVDTCPEVAYDFTLTLQSVTRDSIVIGDGHGGVYVVPKRLRPTFDAVDFNQSIGVLTMSGKTYLAFDEHRVYIDVSTPELMADAGIEHIAHGDYRQNG